MTATEAIDLFTTTKTRDMDITAFIEAACVLAEEVVTLRQENAVLAHELERYARGVESAIRDLEEA